MLMVLVSWGGGEVYSSTSTSSPGHGNFGGSSKLSQSLVPITAMGPGRAESGRRLREHLHTRRDAGRTPRFLLGISLSHGFSLGVRLCIRSAANSAGDQQMPETGGLALDASLLALAALIVGVAGIAYVRRVVRGP
jgi:hypothetical protein